MTIPELLSWWDFYNLYPFDDFNRFHRPAAWVANSFSGRDITQSLQWLQAEPRPAGVARYTDVEVSLIQAFSRVRPAPAAAKKPKVKKKG